MSHQDIYKVVMSHLYSHVPNRAVVAKTPAELMQKHRQRCLLKPVRIDQSEQIFFGGESLKRQALERIIQTEDE